MNVICVDDEIKILKDIAVLCRSVPQVTQVNAFPCAGEALDWLEDHPADIAILDIDLPDINGIRLAEKIKRKSPDTIIIFLTAYSRYAVDAFKIHANGYLLKPVTQEMIDAEIRYALTHKPKMQQGRVFIQTFGGFDVFADGKPVKFKLRKCKEILAFLVDKQGCSATRAEVFACIWEDCSYDRKMQKQLDVYIRKLRETLQDYNIEEIFELSRGTMRVRTDKFICDAYLFLQGDHNAVNSYRGNYMEAYSWATMTDSAMIRKQWESINHK